MADEQEQPEAQQSVAEDEEMSEEEEENERLPFPNARVVKIIKDNLKNEHQIKKEARVAANHFLGEMLSDVAQSMDQEQYFTLSIEHFNNAARKYREIGLQKKRIQRIKKVLEKQRAELDEIIAEIELHTQ